MKWHAQTRMDDVDYLVEDNARDDFACACSQELEHLHIHQGFTNIRVKDPGNTTYYHDEQRWMMQMQRKITFSDFTLARPRKQNLDDQPRDI